MQKKRSILKTQTLVKRKRRLFWIKVGVLCVVVLSLCGGIIALARARFSNIQTVSVQGTIVASDTDITAEVDKILDGNYFFFFPKRSILLYPKSQIAASVMKSFPRLEKTDVSLLRWHTLNVNVTERKPYAMWCAGGEPTGASTTDNCYFMDVTGFIFDTAPSFSGNTYIRYWGGTMGEEPIGQTFKTELTFTATDNLIQSLEKFDFHVTDIIANEYGYELRTEEGTDLLINPGQDVMSTLDNLSIVLKENTKATTTLSSIDLRFGNKVYIKRE